MSMPRVTNAGAVLLLLSLSTFVYGGDRRRVRAVSPPSSASSIVFLEGGVLETGTIVWRGGARRSAVTRRTVRVRIGEPSNEPRGSVTMRAFLETNDPRCTIRVDGVTLGAAPRVIRRHAPVGVAFTHRIEIEVPVTAVDGPLHASIGWEAITE